MKRMIAAFYNSVAAWNHLIRTEKAFQEEAIALAVAIPAAFFLSSDGWTRLVLIGVVIMVMIVEVLNTGIEAACDALSREYHADIKIAKDCGSLAVLLSITIAGLVWAMTVWRLLVG